MDHRWGIVRYAGLARVWNGVAGVHGLASVERRGGCVWYGLASAWNGTAEVWQGKHMRGTEWLALQRQAHVRNGMAGARCIMAARAATRQRPNPLAGGLAG